MIAAHPVACGLAMLWLVLTIAIVVAGWRNAFDADRTEQEVEIAQDRMTLAQYQARALPETTNRPTPLRGSSTGSPT